MKAEIRKEISGDMKKISVVIPCYKEEKSIQLMYERLVAVFQNELTKYDYEIFFVDDCSPDNTWQEIEKVCAFDRKVKGIRNAKNFGFSRNVFSTFLQGSGDATFMLFGDLQDPPELLPEFVKKWEEGYKVIIGQKYSSSENPLLYFFRTIYYKLIRKMASNQQIEHFNGFGLYDRVFVDTIRNIEDPVPYLRGIISEFGMNMYIMKYHQAKSERGSSGFNFFKYYDEAMIGVTSYTKLLMRAATFVGMIMGIGSILIALYVFVYKLLHWDSYPIGTASIIIGIFLIGAVQLFFIGILGEYILSINARLLKRPLVVIEKRLNFDQPEAAKENRNAKSDD